MRKFYLLFFLFKKVLCYFQTYDFDVVDDVSCNTCWEVAQGPTYNTLGSIKIATDTNGCRDKNANY